MPRSNAQLAATSAPDTGRSESPSTTMPSYGPRRSAARTESGRTGKGARSTSGPHAIGAAKPTHRDRDRAAPRRTRAPQTLALIGLRARPAEERFEERFEGRFDVRLMV